LIKNNKKKKEMSSYEDSKFTVNKNLLSSSANNLKSIQEKLNNFVNAKPEDRGELMKELIRSKIVFPNTKDEMLLEIFQDCKSINCQFKNLKRC
jgi:hypothetical protein